MVASSTGLTMTSKTCDAAPIFRTTRISTCKPSTLLSLVPSRSRSKTRHHEVPILHPPLTLLALTPLASAQSPHFQSQGASATINDAGALIATWQERGLGNNQLITYTVTADGLAQYACINRGGQHPKASNKETVQGPLSATAQFSSGRNGGVNGQATLGPLGPGSFSCPSGQTLVLAKLDVSGRFGRGVSPAQLLSAAGEHAGGLVTWA
ncbi:hypothetical protein B0I37DRAFT_424038 [Chaetomium sp. MPI-CAGE-AT-0009]|nr:hypothetical protein B0I37DRAFT_424038 [Chaetomium sp. MPI-CAGE-AT-0009]